MSLDAQSQQQLLASDPNARFLGVSCLDLLLIEIVPMAERMTEELNNNTPSTATATTTAATTTVAGTAATTISGKLEDEEMREATFYRLESLGYRVGQGLAERYATQKTNA
jgi:trafficking protein particle complex subunit 6